MNAVRADQLLSKAISFDDHWMHLGDIAIDRSTFDRVLVVGGGKAAAAMAIEFQRMVSPHFPVYGWVNVPEGTTDPSPIGKPDMSTGQVRIHAARPAGLNEPTQTAVEGTKEIFRLVQSANDRDLCVCLITGGGSALLTWPSDGISLDDKLAVIRKLSGSGADITELNTVRKQLSNVKGGGLLRACRAGQLVTLILSDVLGDPLDLIASGPTVPNRSTPRDALTILKKYDPTQELPTAVYQSLQHKSGSNLVSHPKSQTIILGNNATAVDAAGVCAETLGYSHAMTAATSSEGGAADVGIHLADMAVWMLQDVIRGKHSPDCLITGGEPTVKLPPTGSRGRGGRNTHVVLAAAKRLRDLQVDQSSLDQIVILSGGTDGEDGPTDAAGAILSGNVWREANRLQLDPADFLERCDSYTFFQLTGGLIITGPTHTNVCDLRVAIVR